MKLRWKEQFESQLQEMFGGYQTDGVWIAGGAARGWILNEYYNDIDIFFDSRERMLEIKALLESRGGRVIRQREELFDIKLNGALIQLCSMYYFATMDELLDDFDFTMCRFGVDLRGNVTYSKADYADSINMTLRIHRLKYPITAFRRVDKFLKRGYTPCKGFWEDLIFKMKGIENTYEHRALGKC